MAIPELSAGSIQIVSAMLHSYSGTQLDIRTIISEFNIFESINQPFISANVVISDSLALTSAFPIIGEELLMLSFKTPHSAFLKTVSLELRIIAIENLKSSNLRTETLVLRCVSPEMVQNQKVKIRQSFKDMPIHDMAQKVFEQYILSQKPFTKKDSIGNRTIVIPNMTPARAMQLLGEEAYAGDCSNYTFFQTADGFYWTTIDELITKRKNSIIDPYITLDMNTNPDSTPRTVGMGRGGYSGGISKLSNKPYEFLKIKHFEFDSYFNYNRTQLLGGLETTVRFLDPASSTYYEKRYTYATDFPIKIAKISRNGPQPVLNTFNPYVGTGESRTEFRITNAGQQNEYGNDQRTEFWHYNTASKALLENMSVTVTIPGDSEKRAGDIVYLRFPEFGATDDVIGRENRYISGNFLITSCRHKYNEEGYETIMKCTKNAFESPIGTAA